jgi:hypothetical protein
MKANFPPLLQILLTTISTLKNAHEGTELVQAALKILSSWVKYGVNLKYSLSFLILKNSYSRILYESSMLGEIFTLLHNPFHFVGAAEVMQSVFQNPEGGSAPTNQLGVCFYEIMYLCIYVFMYLFIYLFI